MSRWQNWLTIASILSSCKIFPGHITAGILLWRRGFDAKLNVLLIISAFEIKTQKKFFRGVAEGKNSRIMRLP
ncbi:hypothetical protein FNJ41_26560 [Escherichia coli]|nr:hypothetical protein [Escherichia coli]EFB3657290.1 hypothetical protein [Escherichia coli]